MWNIKITNADRSKFMPGAAKFGSEFEALKTLTKDFDTINFLGNTKDGLFYELHKRGMWGKVYVVVYHVE